MVTVTQTQTARALWIKDVAEMLETHLKEVKHQGELKRWHPEPLAHGRLLHTTIHWKNRWAATPMPLLPTLWLSSHCLPPATSSKCSSRTFGRPNRWAPSITWYPSVTPGINQHNSLDRLINPAKQQQQQQTE
jgi:hypothetical protein